MVPKLESMKNRHTETSNILTPAEIQRLLSLRLIANLATVDDDGSIHLVPMWFLRVEDNICIPTSHNTHSTETSRKDQSRLL